MSSFSVPFVPTNPNSWGPPADESESVADAHKSKFWNLPYAPFGRADRVGKVADFTTQWGTGGRDQRYRDRRRYGEDQGKNEGFQYKAEEDESFQLVDTTRASSQQKRFVAPAARRRQQQTRLRQLNARRSGQGNEKENARYNQPQRTRRRNNWGGGRFGGRGQRGGWRDRVDRQASVGVRADWTVTEEFDLSKLAKLRSDVPKEEDLLWCGFLDQYNDSYDKVSTKTAAPLKRSETKEFYPVTTTDDPVIEKLAIEGAGNIFITDAILSHLMACPRSVYPWDIVVQKLPDGTLFFDKRDASQFDFLTVCETANVPPPAKSDDDPEGINTPQKLSLEATSINQNFSQQILKSQNVSKTRKNFDLPNPFYDQDDAEGMEPASVAYRYRRFTLGDMQLVCRTETHGLVRKKGGEEQIMTAFALNEWDSKAASGGINWRDKIDTQRGAVLATELKNNSCKLAKWTAQSILAGADQMKIGFVSRVSTKNNYEHAILATQFYRPKEFASQITLNVSNMWGIVKMLVDLFAKMPEGKYVLMRDPNKPIVRLYSVPPGTFEDDDEEEEAASQPGQV
mmetsp:Transcript_25657/g.37772  ORF Transcript_25657/g.37772 Transcript_25657/m.37772 type:complete len:569 (+) Transcript_25657:66-1772(+)|eukprot:CAMPEP_0195518536 /NCGR_PEP_ID=MMETSP0794_2-20130614/13100_1 /TAXON_ID=515487 /ORGANISM="Stephanopyxis turris, Strain CCMP 815" /LENGTH=568 /DNA_ID=CAMNT_0040647519 /DNA_START=60 /DNA_END=1766 /DNA_ORIENTATION=+